MSSSIHRFWYTPFLVLGLAWPQGPAGEVEELSGDPEEAPAVELPPEMSVAELWEHPANHLGESVVLTVQIQSKLRSWNPLLTRFGDGQYSAWDAWADAQFPWNEADYLAPQVRVFARHDSAAEWALSDAEPLERYTLTCKVQSVLADRPWLEVVAVKPRVRKLGEGCLIHASRGLDMMDKELWKGAIDEFERASAGGIHEAAKRELERLIEDCREKIPVEIYRRVER